MEVMAETRHHDHHDPDCECCRRVKALERALNSTQRALHRLRLRVDWLDRQAHPAVLAKFTFGTGDPMADTTASMTIDQAGHGTVGFTDRDGNPTAPPAGASVAYTSSDETIATVAPDPANAWECDCTSVGPLGVFTLTPALTGALEADGVTPIPDPTPIDVTVEAGAAAGADVVFTTS